MPDPLVALFARLGEQGVVAAKDLPPAAKELESLDAPTWLERLGAAVRALEEAP